MAYDLIVIGGGPGGYTAAIRAAQLGRRAALVEAEELGGTCLNRGCIPTKTLMHAAGLYAALTAGEQFGIYTEGLHFDFAQMHQRKNEVVSQLRDGIGQLLRANGVEVICGRGKIMGPGLVSVDKAVLEAEHILIAAGSVPVLPGIPGIRLPGVLTSDDLLNGQPKFNHSMIIIGGGVIGVEMASLYSNLGCSVTVIEAMDRLLPLMDREISQNLAMILKKRGVVVNCGAAVEEMKKEGELLRCTFRTKKEEQSCCAEAVLVAVGRVPRTDGLFGEGVDPERNGRFLKVDLGFQTSLPGVYAVGDVIGGSQLAHAAEAQGIAAAERICGRKESAVKEMVIPACVYTEPEIAAVGMTADEAKQAGRTVKRGKYVLNSNAKTLLEHQERSFISLIFDTESDRLLGAQLMCARATDLIGELTTAVANGMTRAQLLRAVRPHPTFSEGVTEAALAAEGESIHSMPPRTFAVRKTADSGQGG